MSDAPERPGTPPHAHAIRQALDDPVVRETMAAAILESLESRRPPTAWERLQPWATGVASAFVTLLAFFLPSLQDQWDRYEARQVVQRYDELGRDFMREGRYGLAEEAFAKALDLSDNHRLDIEEERLEARLEQVNADPDWGAANPAGLAESDFIYLLHLRKGPEFAKQRSRTLSSYGVFLASDHRLSEAESTLRESVHLDSTNTSAFVHLGNVLSDRGDKAHAEAAYRRAIVLDSTMAPAWFDLGVLLEQGGRLREAESAYRKSVAYDPDDRDALEVLADLLARTGREHDAQEFRARLRAMPKLPSPVQKAARPPTGDGSGDESPIHDPGASP